MEEPFDEPQCPCELGAITTPPAIASFLPGRPYNPLGQASLSHSNPPFIDAPRYGADMTGEGSRWRRMNPLKGEDPNPVNEILSGLKGATSAFEDWFSIINLVLLGGLIYFFFIR